MRNAIVTGGRGFIGRHLVLALREQGVLVTTIGRNPAADPMHIVLDQDSWNAVALERLIAERAPDCIFHLAGQTYGTVAELARINVGLTRTLLRAVGRAGVRPTLIIAGSAAEYGSAINDGEPIRESADCAPLSAYGASKHAQTCAALEYADAAGARVLVARIFNPLGPHMPAHLALGDFVGQIASMPRKRGTLRVGNIDVRRDMIDVEHVATLLHRLALHPDARGIVNVCSGQAPLLRDLVEMLIDACGGKVEILVDWERIRGNEPRVIVGSTDRLEELGCLPPPTDFPAVIARMSRAIDESTACAS